MTHEYECAQEGCHFSIRSDDDGEVVHMVREHATDRHGMSVTDKDIRKTMHAA